MIVAVDADSRDTGEAEHLLHELLAPAGPLASSAAAATARPVAGTHVVRGGDRAHLAIAVTIDPSAAVPGKARSDDLLEADLTVQVHEWAVDRGAGCAVLRSGAAEPLVAGPGRLVRGAYVAAVEAALGTAGRLVRFPGQDQVRGALRVGDLRARCGIDVVEAVGGLPVDDDSCVDTLDFIRPIRRSGQVVLLAQPAAGGVLIPFEVEHQLKCCTDH